MSLQWASFCRLFLACSVFMFPMLSCWVLLALFLQFKTYLSTYHTPLTFIDSPNACSYRRTTTNSSKLWMPEFVFMFHDTHSFCLSFVLPLLSKHIHSRHFPHCYVCIKSAISVLWRSIHCIMKVLDWSGMSGSLYKLYLSLMASVVSLACKSLERSSLSHDVALASYCYIVTM